MSSITVGELKTILDQYPDNYEVIMSLKHSTSGSLLKWNDNKYSWIAYINGVKADHDYQTLKLIN